MKNMQQSFRHSFVEKPIDFWLRKGKAGGEPKTTERTSRQSRDNLETITRVIPLGGVPRLLQRASTYALILTMLFTLGVGEMWGGTRRIYCTYSDVSSWWGNDGANSKPFAYAWHGGTNNKYSPTSVTGQTNMVYFDIDDAHTSVIFYRGTGVDAGWWNQTVDITIGANNHWSIQDSKTDGKQNVTAGKYAPTPAISGEMNSWKPDANVFSGTSGSVTCSVTLNANSKYEFKVVTGFDWYGYGSNTGDLAYLGQSGTTTLSTSGQNICIATAGAGTYTFTWNCTSHTLSVAYPSVTHPSSDYVYFKNTAGWANVKAHVFTGSAYIDYWPGPEISSFNFDGTNYYYAALGDKTSIIFSKSGDDSKKTGDLTTASSNKGRYYDFSSSTWKDFTATLTLDDESATTSVTPSSVTVTYNATTNINTDIITTTPAKTGYTFGGFYTGKNGGGTQIIGTNEKIPSDLTGYTTSGKWTKTGSSVSTTLYAKWTANQYTISLNRQSGSGGPSSITVTYETNSNMTSAITKPTRDGYTFAGYYTLSYGSGKQIIDKDGNFNSAVTDYITDGKWTRADGATLYAYWKHNCSASAYTIRYFGDGVAYESSCFEQVGETHEWNISNFAIPSNTKYSVGYNEDVYDSDLGTGVTKSASVTKTWTDTYAQTDGIGNGAMQLLPAGASARAVGQATGALGTLVIWDNSADKNLSVGFRPNGYGVTTADDTYAFTAGSGTFYYSDVVTISSGEASGNFQVKLVTSDSYVACAQGTAEAASAVSARKISGDANIASGKKGVFQMWSDATANNFSLRFVTVYDVSFDMQGHGSSIADYEDVRYNDKIAAPTAPTATGYTFGGWYKEDACTNAWDFDNDVVTATTVLYAKWTANDYTVTLNRNGGTAGAESVTATYDAALPSFTLATKSGYRLTGYYTASSGGTRVIDESGNLVSGVDGYTDGSGHWTHADDDELYAQWGLPTPNTFDKDNYTACGGGISGPSGEYFDYANGTGSHTDGYVDWRVYLTPCKYSITIAGYYHYGHTWEVYLIKDGVTVSTCSFDPDYSGNIYFEGTETKTWNLSGQSAGDYIVRVKNIYSGATPKLKSLTINHLTVTYDANGGTCATESNRPSSCGGSVTLPSATRSGYDLAGWYNGSTKIGDADDTYTPTDDVTLKAVWTVTAPATLDKDNIAFYGGKVAIKGDTIDYSKADNHHRDGSADWMVTVEKCVYTMVLNGYYENGHNWKLYLINGSDTLSTCVIPNTDITGTYTETATWDLTGLTNAGTYVVRVRNIRDYGEPKLLSVAMNLRTVTYDANGGTCAKTSDTQSECGGSVTLPTVTRAGHTFAGWYNESTRIGGAGDTYTPTADVTLKAQWAIIVPNTLDKDNYMACGGGITGPTGDYFNYKDGTGERLNGYVDWRIYLTPCKYSVTMDGLYHWGHEWKLYLISGSDTIATCPIERKSGDGVDTTYTEIVTWDLSAQSAGEYIVRVKNMYSGADPKLKSLTISHLMVTYDANGGTCATESDIPSSCGGSVTLPSATRAGYEFDGWYSGSTKVGEADDTYSPTDNVTLKAVWAVSAPVTLTKDNIAFYGGKVAINDDEIDYSNADDSHRAGYADWRVKVKKCSYTVTLNGTYPNGHQWKLYLINGSDTLSYYEFGKTWDEGTYTETATLDLSGLASAGVYTLRARNIMKDGSPKLLSVALAPVDTITLDLQGATNVGEATDMLTVTYGTADYYPYIIAPAEKTDYAFFGFWTGTGGTGLQVISESNHIIAGVTGYTDAESKWIHDGDVTLYAYWEELYIFTGATDNKWSKPANWANSQLPDITKDVYVYVPVEVDITNAAAKSVLLDQSSSRTGRLTIGAGKALVVKDSLTRTTDGSTRIATRVQDLYIASGSTGNGSLVVGNHKGTNQAQVDFYTLASKDASRGYINQYIGTPFASGRGVKQDYYGSYLYSWDAVNQKWSNIKDEDYHFTPFLGYNILRKDAAASMLELEGTLVATTDKVISLTYNEGKSKEQNENVLANSWTAPIDIAAIGTSAFSNCEATIYIMNAGSKTDHEGAGAASASATNPAQWIALPVNSAPWSSPTVTKIPSMQGFSVYATGTSPTLTLNYTTAVYTPALANTTSAVNPATRAPRRTANDNAPEVIRLRVTGTSGYADQLCLLLREDFTDAFDNGWDGHKVYGKSYAPQLFSVAADGEKMAVDCKPEVEGTLVGMKAGDEDEMYTMTFEYESNEPLYLLDVQTNTYTDMRAGNAYTFYTNDTGAHNRFVLTRFAPQMPTGVEEPTSDSSLKGREKAMKFIEDNKMYILLRGVLYDATGKRVSVERVRELTNEGVNELTNERVNE